MIEKLGFGQTDGYDPNIRPVKNVSTVTNITIDLSLVQLLEIVKILKLIRVFLFLKLKARILESFRYMAQLR